MLCNIYKSISNVETEKSYYIFEYEDLKMCFTTAGKHVNCGLALSSVRKKFFQCYSKICKHHLVLVVSSQMSISLVVGPQNCSVSLVFSLGTWSRGVSRISGSLNVMMQCPDTLNFSNLLLFYEAFTLKLLNSLPT